MPLFQSPLHGDQPGGTLHSAATGSTAGFMSADDKAIFDKLRVRTHYVSCVATSNIDLTATTRPSMDEVQVLVTNYVLLTAPIGRSEPRG